MVLRMVLDGVVVMVVCMMMEKALVGVMDMDMIIVKEMVLVVVAAEGLPMKTRVLSLMIVMGLAKP